MTRAVSVHTLEEGEAKKKQKQSKEEEGDSIGAATWTPARRNSERMTQLFVFFVAFAFDLIRFGWTLVFLGFAQVLGHHWGRPVEMEHRLAHITSAFYRVWVSFFLFAGKIGRRWKPRSSPASMEVARHLAWLVFVLRNI